MARSAGDTTAMLDELIGEWRTTGEVLADDGQTVVRTFTGTDRYEWLGNYFAVHHVDVQMGEEHVQTLEVIGPYDADRDAFQAAAYNGIAGNVEYSTTTVDDSGIWSFHTGSGRMRAQSTLHVDQDGKHMRGRWWRTENEGKTWTPWMRLTLARQ